MGKVRLSGFLALAASVTACSHMSNDSAAGGAADASFTLAGSSWQLVEITSGEPTSGSVEAGLYTLLIRADGTAAFRLDCNRGFGRWEGTTGSESNSGSLSFTDIGVTRALCPPESISDQVAADLSRIDAFEMSSSQLILSARDGEVIYRWEPLNASSSDPTSK